jgi:hypothetical protein
MPRGTGAAGDHATAAQPATKALAMVLVLVGAAGAGRAVEAATAADSAAVH